MKDFILLTLANILILIAVFYKRPATRAEFNWKDWIVLLFLLFFAVTIARIVGW